MVGKLNLETTHCLRVDQYLKAKIGPNNTQLWGGDGKIKQVQNQLFYLLTIGVLKLVLT